MNAKTVAAALVSVTLVGVAACGDDHQSLGGPDLVVQSLPSDVTSITISGKTSSAGVNEWGAWLGMVPGETARLMATATFSDNTERDVTAEMVWTCSNDESGAVGVVSPGVIRAERTGWVTLVARYGSGQSSNGRAETRLRVAPEGAFLLGIAVDDGHWELVDALVQVTSSAGTFSGSTSGWGGIYLPVAGDTVMQVEKAGYVTITKSMTVSSDQEVVYTLQPSGTVPFTATGR